jgi:ribosome biogenesis protein BRX1
MQRKESLFVVNEIAEMKNCNKCLLFEGRRSRKDLYLWAANVARGPSAKFLVENVHTMGELKLTGNCLKSSRPLLSFDKSFDAEPHWQVVRELFTQIFSVPNHHPRSQPFFDHVFTFSVVDDKVWFRNFQIVAEDGSLAEIGPRFVLNPIKVFDASFSGQTLWENEKYVTPTAHR